VKIEHFSEEMMFPVLGVMPDTISLILKDIKGLIFSNQTGGTYCKHSQQIGCLLPTDPRWVSITNGSEMVRYDSHTKEFIS
jgi:hypothetical protein